MKLKTWISDQKSIYFNSIKNFIDPKQKLNVVTHFVKYIAEDFSEFPQPTILSTFREKICMHNNGTSLESNNIDIGIYF